jgi:F-type H+-transporting ATPase subunit b
MPQLSQLPEIFWSQLFWLVVVFGITFFVIGMGMVPKVQSTVDAREKKIASDLELAQAARAGADQTEAAWRARMDAARSEAAKLAQDAKQRSAQESEKTVKAAAEQINLKVESSQAKIRESLEAARADIVQVAAEATSEMVHRLTGIQVAGTEAAQAVKAEIYG